jgi:hypothetical protein
MFSERNRQRIKGNFTLKMENRVTMVGVYSWNGKKWMLTGANPLETSWNTCRGERVDVRNL